MVFIRSMRQSAYRPNLLIVPANRSNAAVAGLQVHKPLREVIAKKTANNMIDLLNITHASNL
jgi:hypothetical protein